MAVFGHSEIAFTQRVEFPRSRGRSSEAEHQLPKLRKAAPMRLARATSPTSQKRSARSCSGSPESATPVAASTSSFSSTAPGMATLKALTTASAAFDPLLGPVPSAHVDQQPCRHAGEGGPEVGVGPDFLHVGGGPPRLGSQDIELHEEDRLPHTPEARIDRAPLVGAGVRAARPGRRRTRAPRRRAGQGPGFASGSGRVRVVALVHAPPPSGIFLKYPLEDRRNRIPSQSWGPERADDRVTEFGAFSRLAFSFSP